MKSNDEARAHTSQSNVVRISRGQRGVGREN